MQNQKTILNKIIICLPVFLFLIFVFNFVRNNSTLFMPKEYKTIKKLVNKIAAKNNLGDKEIIFSIANGRYMSWRAKELDLCKEDECWYFNNLNPYKKYKNLRGINLNELGKQAYLYGGIEGYAWRGIVWLSRSTFRSYGEKTDLLACTIGHEISHVIFDSHINDSIKLSENLKNIEIENNNYLKKDNNKEDNKNEDYKNEERNFVEMELSRQSEKKADFEGAKMLINAGFPKDTCLKELKFLTEFEKLETETNMESTHPGYLERYKSLEKSIDNYDKFAYLNSFKPYSWKWKYKRKINSLIFIPIK